MDVREKLVELMTEFYGVDPMYYGVDANAIADHLLANDVTVQEWVKVEERLPTEADGTVLVCLADVFPYNEKEPYIGAKHDGRVTEAHYSEFSDSWYIRGSVVPYGDVTHWMSLPQLPK